MTQSQNTYLKICIQQAVAHKNVEKANRLSKLLYSLTGEVMVSGQFVKVN